MLTVTVENVVALFLAFAPIFDPYILLEVTEGITIRVNDLGFIILGSYCFLKDYRFTERTGFLLIILIGLLIFSTLGNIASDTDMIRSIKNFFVWFIYSVLISYIWKIKCREQFRQIIKYVATVASFIVIAQFITAYLSIPMWDGRLPFLNISKYDGWAGYYDIFTGDIRPNAFFQEPSYVGIYLSVALASVIPEEKIAFILLFCIAMFLSKSLVAIVCMFIIFSYYLFIQDNIMFSKKFKSRIIMLLSILSIFIFINGIHNQAILNSVDYIINRINRIEYDLADSRMSSTRYRLIGYSYLFSNYDFYQQLFGVGVANFSAYFNIPSYSNVWVVLLLNVGICGLSWFIFNLIRLCRCINSTRMIYFLIILAIFSADYQWFNWYFFFLFSAVILDTSEVASVYPRKALREYRSK